MTEQTTERSPENVAYERLAEGLKHMPRGADWDPDTIVWGCNEWADFGATNGWLWATDKATALIEQAEGIVDSEWKQELGRKVLEIAQAPMPGPLYGLKLNHIVQVGGTGHVPKLGDFDLDRVREAALWAGGGRDAVVVAVEHKGEGLMLRIVGGDSPTRVAVVVSCQFKGDWHPTVEIPLEDHTDHPAVLPTESKVESLMQQLEDSVAEAKRSAAEKRAGHVEEGD